MSAPRVFGYVLELDGKYAQRTAGGFEWSADPRMALHAESAEHFARLSFGVAPARAVPLISQTDHEAERARLRGQISKLRGALYSFVFAAKSCTECAPGEEPWDELCDASDASKELLELTADPVGQEVADGK